MPRARRSSLASLMRMPTILSPAVADRRVRVRHEGSPAWGRLVGEEIIWAPAIKGAFVLSTRGGDFALHIGQDVSIGYLSYTDSAVRLYLQETFTFLLLTAEAAVVLAPPGR